MTLHPVRRLRYWAVDLLPAGARARYDEEYRADLSALSGWRALRYAGSVLLGAPGLRRALLAADPSLAYHRPALCALGRHDDVTVHGNAEDQRMVHEECRRCGRIKDGRQYLQRSNNDEVAWVGAHWQC
jgi:hypothetical protein